MSKDTVDVAIHGQGYLGSFRRDADGLSDVVTALAGVDVHRVLVEAPGGYEQLPLAVLDGAGLPVVLLEPSRARHFARAVGRYAKTDAIACRSKAEALTHAPGVWSIWKI